MRSVRQLLPEELVFHFREKGRHDFAEEAGEDKLPVYPERVCAEGNYTPLILRKWFETSY
jgi:hypothetical protein